MEFGLLTREKAGAGVYVDAVEADELDDASLSIWLR